MIYTSAVTNNSERLEKSPTGIRGLDEITEGGFPKGRPTLVCGSAGSGKTLLSMQFLAKGATEYGEPGVFVAFEEAPEELSKNFASLGFDLKGLVETNKLLIDHIHIDANEIEETGEYDLEGLFVRLNSAIDSIGAKRVVLDTLEVLFSGFKNEAILRNELRRLFKYLKSKGVTALVTGERGENSLTRYGLEEYVADCVILLDNRMENQIATRRMRIIKYRGSKHGTNEYPFMVGRDGVAVLPITSLGLEHIASRERLSTGMERLDTMMGGNGYYRGSSIMIVGTAGTGKSSFAAHFANAACSRGERCLYFAFEESPSQITRNMSSVGIDLDQWIREGLLKIHSSRPTVYGLEMHLTDMLGSIEDFSPEIVVIDPISNLSHVGTSSDVNLMLTRLIDFLKAKGITAVTTSLKESERDIGTGSAASISSLMDTCIRLRMFEGGSERNRGISIIKSRGMAHSNQIREFLITSEGLKILDVYLGPEGKILMGSERAAQEAKEREGAVEYSLEIERKKRDLENRLRSLDSQISMLRSEFETNAGELSKLSTEFELQSKAAENGRREMARLRKADASRMG